MPHLRQKYGSKRKRYYYRTSEKRDADFRRNQRSFERCICTDYGNHTQYFGKTPPELAADVAERGIVLTGGGALLGGLEELIEEETGINTVVAEEPALAVAIGTGQYMELMSKMNGRL